MQIGVLAIQGDYARHVAALHRLGHSPLLVRTEKELNQCDGLIIPGGESTTLTIVMQKHNLWEPLAEYGRQRIIFGTCAGLIILAAKVPNHPFSPLGLIDIQIERNAYGRQKESFIDDVMVTLAGHEQHIQGFFIRAPKIIKAGKSVTVLGKHQEEMVLVENDHILAATFHPELTEENVVHRYFLQKIDGRQNSAIPRATN